jgi:hypothetical protein
MKTAHDTLKESGVSERFISSYAGTAVEIAMIAYARQALEEAAIRLENFGYGSEVIVRAIKEELK